MGNPTWSSQLPFRPVKWLTDNPEPQNLLPLVGLPGLSPCLSPPSLRLLDRSPHTAPSGPQYALSSMPAFLFLKASCIYSFIFSYIHVMLWKQIQHANIRSFIQSFSKHSRARPWNRTNNKLRGIRHISSLEMLTFLVERQINESQCRVINAVTVRWAKALEGPNDAAQKFQREDITAQVIQEQGHKERRPFGEWRVLTGHGHPWWMVPRKLWIVMPNIFIKNKLWKVYFHLIKIIQNEDSIGISCFLSIYRCFLFN